MRHPPSILAILALAVLGAPAFAESDLDSPSCARSGLWSYSESNGTDKKKLRLALLNQNEKSYPVPQGKLSSAVVFGFTDIVKTISSDRTTLVSEGPVALVFSVQMGRTEISRVLLDAGVSPNSTYERYPAIFEATRYGNVRDVCLLLNYGAHINQPISSPTKLLEIAILGRHYDEARLLMAAGYTVKAAEASDLSRIAKRQKSETKLSKILATTPNPVEVSNFCAAPQVINPGC